MRICGYVAIAAAEATAASAYRAYRDMELTECRHDVDANTAHVQQLLSGGRFVRKYYPATGHSVYTFARGQNK